MSKKNPSNPTFDDAELRKMVDNHLAQKKKSPPPLDAGGGGSSDGFKVPYETEKDGLFDFSRQKPPEAEQPSPFPEFKPTLNQGEPTIGYRRDGLMAGIEDNITGNALSPIQKQESEKLKNLQDIYTRIQGKNLNDSKASPGEINTGREIPISEKVGNFKSELGSAFASGLDRLGQMGALLPSATLDQFNAMGKNPQFLAGLNILTDWIKAPGKIGGDSKAADYFSSVLNAPFELQAKLEEKAKNDMDSEQLAQMVEKATGLPQQYNPFSPNNGIVKLFAERAKKNEELAYKNYNGGITEAIRKGDFATAGKLTSLGVVQSLPLMVGLAASRGAGASEATSLGLMGMGSFAQTYQDLKESNPEIDKQLLFGNALMTGLGEAGSEMLGTNLIYNQGLKLLKRGAVKEAEQVIKTGIRGFVDGAFRKAFVGVAALDEGSTELVNQVWKNFVDKHTGVKPDVDYMDGAWDAFIVGNGAGAAFAAPFHAASKVVDIANKRAARSIVDQNNAIGPYLQSANISPDVKEKLTAEVAANNEKLNDLIDQDAQQSKILSPKQKSRVDAINVDIDSKEAIAANPSMPAPIREASKKSAQELETTANDILQDAKKRTEDIAKAIRTSQAASTPEQVQKSVATIAEHAEDAIETPQFQEAVNVVSEKVEELKKVKPKENEDTTVKDNLLKQLETELDALKLPVSEQVPAEQPVVEPQTITNEETPIVPVQNATEAKSTPQADQISAKKVSKREEIEQRRKNELDELPAVPYSEEGGRQSEISARKESENKFLVKEINNRYDSELSKLSPAEKQPERVKYQSNTPANNKFYVKDKEGNPVEITDAKKVTGVSNEDLFVHKPLKGTGFVVSEGITGFKVGEGKTSQEAVENAKANIGKMTSNGENMESFYKLLNDTIEKQGKTPRYETESENSKLAEKIETAKPATKPSETKVTAAVEPKATIKEIAKESPNVSIVSMPKYETSSKAKNDVFPESKVKETVYHGTNNEFTKFEKGHSDSKNSKTNTAGFHFIEESAKDAYSQTYGRMVGAKVNFKNPLVVNYDTEDGSLAQRLEFLTEKDIAEFKKQGYDSGILLRDGEKEYVAFDPEQIEIIPDEASPSKKVDDEIDTAFKDFANSMGIDLDFIPSRAFENKYSNNIDYDALIEEGEELLTFREYVNQYSDFLSTGQKIIAERILSALNGKELTIYTFKKPVIGGFYSSGTDEIYVRMGPDGELEGRFIKTLLHEALHALTLDVMYNGIRNKLTNPKEKVFYDELTDVYKQYLKIVSKEDRGRYGFTNALEFIAEAGSNIGFQRVLSKYKIERKLDPHNLYEDDKPNLLKRILNAINRFFFGDEEFLNRSGDVKYIHDIINELMIINEKGDKYFVNTSVTSPSIIDNKELKSEAIEKGMKLVGLYTKNKIYQFPEMVKDAVSRFGNAFKPLINGFKAAYSSFYSQADDDVADLMTDPREVRKFNIDNFLNEQNNERTSEPTAVEENAPAVSTGEQPTEAGGVVANQPTTEIPGRTDVAGSEAGNETSGERAAEPGRDRGRSSGNAIDTGRRNDGSGATENTDRSVRQNVKKSLKPEDTNHVIAEDDVLVPTGAVGKFNANVDALFLLKKLEAENRNPSPEEKKQLAQFVGWGGLANYLNVRSGADTDAVRAYMDGTDVMVYKNNSYYAKSSIDFKDKGAVDFSKFNSATELINDIRNQLAKMDYSITPDAIRAPMLQALLSKEEYQSATTSTISAHYTDKPVIKGMWDIIEKLGFKGGNVLESSFGIGHIFGMMPESLRGRTSLTAYELDNLTGRMASKLYPQAKVTVDGFENSKVPLNSQDLVVTNVPFGAKAPYDRLFPDLSKFSLHNYFIAKNLKMLKPGGIGVMISSSSTMDAPISSRFREWVNNPVGGNSYLVGAIRLPNNAFDENAGTQVTTDVLIFQKKGENVNTDLEQPFRYTKFLKEGRDQMDKPVLIDVNEYYINNPQQMLGEMMTAYEAGSGALYGQGAAPTLKAPAGFNLTASLNDAINNLPQNITEQRSATTQVQETDDTIDAIDKKEGSLFTKDGKVYRVSDGEGAQVKDLDAKQNAIANKYVDVKSDLLDLVKMELQPVSDEAAIEALRSSLNKKYDDFVKAHGHVNGRAAAFLDDYDVDFPIMSSLENIKRSIVKNATGKGERTVQEISKADILSKRVNFPRIEPTIASDIKDAIDISLNYKNAINVGYISSLLGESEDFVRQRLLDEDLAFDNPDTGLLETPEEYLSGYVRDKLKKAEIALLNDPSYKKNVEALSKVIPEDIPSALISYTLGSSWIPAPIYENFVKDKLGVELNVNYLDRAGKFAVTNGMGAYNALNTNTYAAGGKTGVEIFKATMNNQQIEITDTIKDEFGNKKTVKNPEKTAAAQAMQQQLQDEFVDYIRADEALQLQTERIYNDVFNGQVLRTFRIPSFAHYPGANTSITLREHQKRAVSRALSECTLFAHSVGSGKSYTLITTAMEMKRLGIANKPLISVKNSTRGQIITAFKKLYPGANILAPTDKELEASGRKKLFAKIATRNWDAVILPESQLSMIPDDPARQKAYIMEQIDEIRGMMGDVDKYANRIEYRQMEKSIKDLEGEWETVDNEEKGVTKKGGKSVAKRMADASLKIESGMREALDRKTDNVFNFEELGIDAMLIDEAHSYKRLGFQTSMKNIKGIDTSKSKKSQSVLLKTRWIQEKTGGKNVSFYTGTPISNTMAEAWTFIKYLRPDILEHLGIEYFDQFAKTFGQVIPSLEQTGGGTFKIQNRFAKFQNLPEFITAFLTTTDVVLSSDVKEFQGENALPKLKDGKITQVVVQQSPELKKQILQFRKTLEWFEKLSGKEKRENSHIPLVVFNKAKQASIDLRLLDPNNVDSPGSKVNVSVKLALEKYKETTDIKGVQMIFSDMYQSPEPKDKFLDEDETIVNPAFGKGRFNLFNDIRDKLIAGGVKPEEIIVFTEPKYDKAEKKEATFELANEGKVRFLLGSTERMGVGVNAQQKMVGLFHLDAPARPMDFEQRNGRIVRQGNENDIVEVTAMGVEKTLDAAAFQRLATKQKFINQIMKGEGLDRVTEDPADEVSLTFDEMMAQLSDSPYAMQKLLVDNKVRSEKTKRDNFNAKLKQTNTTYRNEQSHLRNLQSVLVDQKKYAQLVNEKFADGNITELVAGGVTSTEKFGEAANTYIDKLYEKFNDSPTAFAKGAIQVNGVQIQLEVHGREKMGENKLVVMVPELFYTAPEIGLTGADAWGNHGYEIQSGTGTGLMSSLRSKLAAVQDMPAKTEKTISQIETDLIQLEKDANTTFDDTRLKEFEAQSIELQEKMINDKPKEDNDPDDDGGGTPTQTGAEYILDQSNVSGVLSALDRMKVSGGKTLSLIVPIPPALWNGAIEIMKTVVKSTNSAQKAIRVAARYIMNNGGTKAQAADFTQVMNESYGPGSPFAQKLDTIVNKINENRANLSARVEELEAADKTNIKEIKSKLLAVMQDARKMDLIKQGIAKADNAARAIQTVGAVEDEETAIAAIAAVKSFLNNVGYNKALGFASAAYNRLKDINMKNKMALSPTSKQLVAINPRVLTPAELDEYLEIAPVLVSQLDGKDTGRIADNDIALFVDKVNTRMDEDIKDKLIARFKKLGLDKSMSVEEMKQLIEESKEEEAEAENTMDENAFASRSAKKRSIISDVLDINMDELKAKEGIPADKQFMVQGLINIDKSMLSTSDLIRLNQVVTNITYNDKYIGAGYFSKISQGISQIKKYKATVNEVGGGFRPITFDSFIKDRLKGSNLPSLSLTDKYFHLNTFEKVGKATDELLSYGIGNGFQKQKSEMKIHMDGLDKVVADAGLTTDQKAIYRVGVFGELNAYIVGDKRTREQQFQDNKSLFKQSIDALQNGRKGYEQNLYKLLSEIWNDVEGLGTVGDMVDFLTPEEQKVYDYIQKIGQANFNRLYDNNEMYGNAPMKEKANYVHRRYNKLREAGVPLDIVSDEPITAAANGVLGQSGTKQDQRVTRKLPAGKYIDYNMVKSFKLGLNETLNDIHTLGERIKTNFVLNSPAFESALSEGNVHGRQNLNILKNSIKQMVNIQRGVTKLDMDMYSGAPKLMNFFKQIFYSKAVGTVTAAVPQYLSSATFAIAKLNNISSYMQSLHLFTNYVFDSGENMAKSLIRTAGSGTANRDLQGDAQLEDAMDNFTENTMGRYVNPKISQIFDGMNDLMFKSLKFGDRITSLHTWLAGYIDNLIDQGVIKSAFDFTPEMLEQHVANPNTMAATSAETLVSMSNNDSDPSRRADRFVAKNPSQEMLMDLLYPVKKFAISMNNKLWLGVRNLTEWDGGQGAGAKTLVGALASIAIYNAIRDYIINTFLFDAAGKAIISALGLGDEEEDERLKLKMTPEEYEKYKADRRLFKFSSETASDAILGGQNVIVEQGVKNLTNYLWNTFGDEIQKEAKDKKEYAPRNVFYVDNGAASMFGVYGDNLGMFFNLNDDKKTPLSVFADVMQEDSDQDAKNRRLLYSVGLPLANQFLLPSADANRILNRVRKRVERVDEKYIDIKLQDKKSKDYKKFHGGDSPVQKPMGDN